MIGNILEYKGFFTTIEYDAESKSFHGQIEGIDDYINFGTTDSSDVENQFHAAVDDYIDICQEVGKEVPINA